MGFIQRPQTVRARRALFQVHLWVGLIAGLYVFVVSVTGAALVFRIDMQRALFPVLFTPSAGAPADAATILEHVQAAFPGDRVSGIDAPSDTRPTYLAYVMRGSRFLTTLFDPATGRLLGELPERSLVRTVQDLHFDLLGGRTGRVVNGIGATCLLVMVLTGFVIWWPGLATWRRALTVDPTRSWRRITFDLHGAVGFWSGLLVLSWAVTGLYFVWPQAFRSAVHAVSPVTVSRPPASAAAAPGAAKVPWRALIETAQAQAPGQHVARVVVPASETAAFLVMFSEVRPTPAGSPRLTAVYLDQYTGTVLQQAPAAHRTFGDVVMAWVAPLHVGNFGGTGVRVAWLVLGLTPALLFVTGFLMWWARVVRPRVRVGAKAVAAALVLAALATGSPAGAQYAWTLAPRVAPPRVPIDAPMTAERVELGRHLFYDTRLSGNGTQSCATCHLQEKAFTDGRAQGLGSTGMLHPRSPMSLVNVAYRDTLTWAHPALRSLDQQVLVPMLGTDPIELGLSGHEARVYASLERDPVYRRLFAGAFPGDGTAVTTPKVAAALAAFLRSIVSFRSPFDRYRQHEDASAMSAAAQRGMTLFFSNRKAKCISCHRGLNLDGGSKTVESAANEEGIFSFHNTGLYDLPGPLSYPADNTGLHAHTGKPEDVGKFRVPTLRNIAVTAPYMHDGSLATLDDVLDHYVKGGRTGNLMKSTGLQPLTLTQDERADLLAFLESLTDREALTDPRWSNPWR